MGKHVDCIFNVRIINIDGKDVPVLKLVEMGVGLNPKKYVSKSGKVFRCKKVADYKGDVDYVYDTLDDITDEEYHYAIKTGFFSTRETLMGYYKLEESLSTGYYIDIEDDEEIRACDEAFNYASKTYLNSPNHTRFNSEIEALYDEIIRAVIAQDVPIKQLLTALWKNELLRSGSFTSDYVLRNKNNILICGPTGTGKTEVIRRIAKYQDVPMIIEDATRYTEAGYVGSNVEEMLHNLYLKADKDVKEAENGIIVIDKIDKLAEAEKGDQSVSRGSVQESLLKLIEGGNITTKLDRDDADSRFEINTSKITFIGIGAFTGIKPSNNYKLVPNDFVSYGMLPELMGRLPKIIQFSPLDEKDLARILTSSTISPLLDQKIFYGRLGIDLKYDDDFIQYAAKRAKELDCGARSLKNTIEESLDEQAFDVLAGKTKTLVLRKPL